MKPRVSLLLALGLLALLFVPRHAAAAEPVTLAGSLQWDMSSPQGHAYRIFVSQPAGPVPAEGFPVLFVLDGNEMFLTAVETVRAFEHRPDVPPGRDGMLVVGIGYPPGTDVRGARTRDLTPSGSSDPRVKGGGGAEAFADFVQGRLKPELARRVRFDPARQAVFGHSFGGLWVLHVLATRPQAFQAYLASSAALWFGDGAVRGELERRVAARRAGDGAVRVQLTVGEYEQYPAPWAGAPRGDVVAMAADLKRRAQVDSSRQAAAMLAAAPDMEVEFDELAGEDHGSVVPAAISRAVRFLAMPQMPGAPPVPQARQYWEMTPEQRYRLRLQVRDLPDALRIPWLTRLKRNLDTGLSAQQAEQLHDERNRMDQERGTRPHLHNAQ